MTDQGACCALRRPISRDVRSGAINLSFRRCYSFSGNPARGGETRGAACRGVNYSFLPAVRLNSILSRLLRRRCRPSRCRLACRREASARARLAGADLSPERGTFTLFDPVFLLSERCGIGLIGEYSRRTYQVVSRRRGICRECWSGGNADR